MVKLKRRYTLKASTLVEAMIAMVLVTGTFAMASTIYARIVRSNTSALDVKASVLARASEQGIGVDKTSRFDVEQSLRLRNDATVQTTTTVYHPDGTEQHQRQTLNAQP